MGAIYIDGGLNQAKEIIMKYVIIDDSNVGYVIKTSIDYKSKLQEYMQSKNLEFEYVLISTSGPDHKREFEVSLNVGGECVAIATAPNIQHAEEKCAACYLNQISEN